MTKLMVLCGGQRNGSTVLLEGLEASGTVLNCTEVFHPSGLERGRRAYELRLKPELNYFSFLRETPALLGPPPYTMPGQRHVFGAYVRFLQDAALGRWCALNIKMNSWHHLNQVWQSIARPPALLQLLREHDTRFLILKREDTVAQALSEYRAEKSGAWHVPRSEDHVPPGRIEVDGPRVLARARQLEAEMATMERWLSRDKTSTIAYENCFTQESFSDTAIALFSSLLEVAPDQLKVRLPLKRLSYTDANWITNPEQVVAAFSRTNFMDRSPALQGLAGRDAPARE